MPATATTTPATGESGLAMLEAWCNGRTRVTAGTFKLLATVGIMDTKA